MLGNQAELETAARRMSRRSRKSTVKQPTNAVKNHNNTGKTGTTDEKDDDALRQIREFLQMPDLVYSEKIPEEEKHPLFPNFFVTGDASEMYGSTYAGIPLHKVLLQETIANLINIDDVFIEIQREINNHDCIAKCEGRPTLDQLCGYIAEPAVFKPAAGESAALEPTKGGARTTRGVSIIPDWAKDDGQLKLVSEILKTIEKDEPEWYRVDGNVELARQNILFWLNQWRELFKDTVIQQQEGETSVERLMFFFACFQRGASNDSKRFLQVLKSLLFKTNYRRPRQRTIVSSGEDDRNISISISHGRFNDDRIVKPIEVIGNTGLVLPEFVQIAVKQMTRAVNSNDIKDKFPYFSDDQILLKDMILKI